MIDGTRIPAPVLSVLAPIAAALIVAGCDCIQGSGDVQSESRDVAAFTRIVADGSVHVNVSQANTQRVNVTADDNILGHITTTITDGTLTIDNDKCYATSNPVTVDIIVPTLSYLELDGSGNVEVKEFEADDFELVLDGSGDLHLPGLLARQVEVTLDGSGGIVVTGNATTLHAMLDGSGTFNARNFPVRNATAALDGSGDIIVNASDTLDLTLSGSGDIRYAGNPVAVHTKNNGSGSIGKLEMN